MMAPQPWHRIWSRRGRVAMLLWPVALIHGALLKIRRLMYAWGLFGVTRLPVPVIVVGNVYVGGTGKTPITIELARQLALAGWRPGILSRGYGRDETQTRMVTADSTAELVGDEPLLMHRATHLPVAVAAQRADAGHLLLSQHPEVNVLISDDGLQHLALHHDLSFCVFDARRIGNGWLLPAGPLREPWPRIVSSSSPMCWTLSTENPPWDHAWPISRNLSSIAINGHGDQMPVDRLPGTLNAMAGIAQPELFFQGLRDLGLTLHETKAFPDHDPLTEWHPKDATTWVCTEKDAVKIWPNHPQVWAVPLQITFPAELLDEINRALHSWISSRHGQQTA